MFDTKNIERSFRIMKCKAQLELQVFTADRSFWHIAKPTKLAIPTSVSAFNLTTAKVIGLGWVWLG